MANRGDKYNYKLLSQLPETKRLIRATWARHIRNNRCKCYLHYLKILTCIFITINKTFPRLIFTSQLNRGNISKFYYFLKSVVQVCTNVKHNEFFSNDKKLCHFCIEFLLTKNKGFFKLFNGTSLHKKELIVKLVFSMKFYWSFCERRCYAGYYTYFNTIGKPSRGWVNNYSIFLGTTFENIRQTQGNLNTYINTITKQSKLGKRCECFSNFLKIVASILLISHVDDLSLLINPKSIFIKECIKFYKSIRRIFLDVLNDSEHHETWCDECNQYIIQNLKVFGDGICKYNYHHTYFRIHILYADVKTVWRQCPAKCIAHDYHDILGDTNCIKLTDIHRRRG